MSELSEVEVEVLSNLTKVITNVLESMGFSHDYSKIVARTMVLAMLDFIFVRRNICDDDSRAYILVMSELFSDQYIRRLSDALKEV